MMRPVSTCGVGPMPDRSLIFTLMMVLCSVPIGGCASVGDDTEIQVANRRQQKEPLRALGAKDLCAPNPNVFLQMNSQNASSGSYEMRVRNASSAAIFINLIDKGGVYTAIYPYIALHFKRLDDKAWSVAEINPAAFLADGLRRVPVKPGESINFSVQVKEYVPSGTVVAKLKLQFETSSDLAAATMCALSDEFVVI